MQGSRSGTVATCGAVRVHEEPFPARASLGARRAGRFLRAQQRVERHHVLVGKTLISHTLMRFMLASLCF
ncbi:hypothetical protein GYH30_022838 [Glycine max]|nr:hypothetical protein GYH30_022838 [Glycine max]